MEFFIKIVIKSIIFFVFLNDILIFGFGSLGFGFDEFYDMDDIVDLKELELEFDDMVDLKELELEFSGSGSGYNEKDLRDDIFKVVFMLVGMNDNLNMFLFLVLGFFMNLMC